MRRSERKRIPTQRYDGGAGLGGGGGGGSGGGSSSSPKYVVSSSNKKRRVAAVSPTSLQIVSSAAASVAMVSDDGMESHAVKIRCMAWPDDATRSNQMTTADECLSAAPDSISSGPIDIATTTAVYSKDTDDVKLKKEVDGTTTEPTTVTTMDNAGRSIEDECRFATEALALLHPDVVDRNDTIRRSTLLESCGMRKSITDAVISTMLSQNTTDRNSKAAYASLKRRFPGGWSDVARCDDIGQIEDSIRVAGLAKTRAERIRGILRTVQDERGEASLEYLRTMTDDGIKQELARFKGLGPKTISCVLLFALGRDEFPVDTHVWRITQKLGWVSSRSTREQAYEVLNKVVPNDVKLDLHCLLVTHGKHCHACAANGRPQFPPRDGSRLACPLKDLSFRVVDQRSKRSEKGHGVATKREGEEEGSDAIFRSDGPRRMSNTPEVLPVAASVASVKIEVPAVQVKREEGMSI